MREEKYKDWLISQGIGSYRNYISRTKSIERYYGDIDEQYDKDGCSSLLAEFTYTDEDKAHKREPQHRIPINPTSDKDKHQSFYEGTKDFASRINKYIEFREDIQDEQLATKTAVGAPLEAGQFTFTVFDQGGNPVATATNAAGDVTFPAIAFDTPGVFSFTIRETGFPTGWIPDTRVFPVIVTVIENGNGQLVASVSFPDGFPSFTNTFEQPLQPATAIIQAKKRLIGACLCGNDFTFAVFDQGGNEVARATNDACGKIVFPALTFTQPGVFHFTVRELKPSSCGCVMGDRVFPVTVTVTDNGTGQLVATVSYPNGKPVFVNHVCSPCPPCNCCRKGK